MSYIYPEWWDEVPEAQRRAVANGCGPGSWKLDLIPDSLLSVDFTDSCDIHDVEFWRAAELRPGSPEHTHAFHVANARLAVNMAIDCLEQHPERMRHFLPLVCGYVEAVSLGGRHFFGRR